MTTPVAQNQDVELARAQLPPVERAAEPAAEPATDPAPAANDASYAHPQPAATAAMEAANEAKFDPNNLPGKTAKSVAHWIHQHPEAHKHGAGMVVYQYARSALASIPYGLSMAATLAAFVGLKKIGVHLDSKASSGVAKRFGKGLAGFADFAPAKNAAMIGTSFTLYRGTSKLGKWMTEYLFNPKDSEARTAQKVDDLPQEAWRKIKEIAPAESSSTPVSAVVLGFIVSAFPKPPASELTAKINGVERSFDWTRANFKDTPGLSNKLKIMWQAVANPKGHFWKHAAINSFAYALFFELGDRLFKDVQIRRGVWPGEHNSIKALKAAPDEYAQGIQDGNDAANHQKYADSALEAVKERNHYSFFTSEPSVGRFVFRRLLPTAAGITMYTAAKMRWASMLGNNFTYDKGVTFGQFAKKAWGEGAATSLFFLIPIVTEPWEKIYDNFFAAKEKKAQARDSRHAEAKELSPLQQQKYEELLDRVNAKERGAANDGSYAQRA